MRRRSRAIAIAAAAALTTPAASAGAQWPAPQPAPSTTAPTTGQWAPSPAPPPASPWGGMQAGGLTPPPPLPAAPAPGSGHTEEQLDNAKKKDAGRGLEWVWVNVEGGYQHVGLQTFNASEQAFTAGFVPTTANGGMFGGAIGMRLLFFTLGARGRIGFLSPFNLFSVGPELGFHIPIGSIEPHAELGAGWTGLSSFQGKAGDAGALSMHGFYARLGGGADYYFTPVFSCGLAVSFELLGLTRGAVSPDDLAKLKANPNLSADEKSRVDLLSGSASSYGASFTTTAVIGLHL